MIDRRGVLGLAAAGLGALFAAGCTGGPAPAGIGGGPGGTPDTGPGPGPLPPGLSMPPETAPHARTFLSWPSLGHLWDDDLPAVRADVAGIARAVAAFEPVVVCADPADADDAAAACAGFAEVLPLPVDDLWMRDTGPVFVHGERGLVGLDLNFNGWGGKQEHGRDGRLARRMLEHYGITRVRAPFVAEGGALEIDGRGALLTTESAVVNANRNPGRDRADLERDLRRALGVTRVVWLPGLAGHDITDGHVDGLARFAPGGAVLLDGPSAPLPEEVEPLRRARAILDGTGAPVVTVPQPDASVLPPGEPEFLASYLNYHVVNGGVVMPAFGDRAADDRARGIVAEQHPGRRVAQIRIDVLAAGGGGIHCATQQQPAGDTWPP